MKEHNGFCAWTRSANCIIFYCASSAPADSVMFILVNAATSVALEYGSTKKDVKRWFWNKES